MARVGAKVARIPVHNNILNFVVMAHFTKIYEVYYTIPAGGQSWGVATSHEHPCYWSMEHFNQDQDGHSYTGYYAMPQAHEARSTRLPREYSCWSPGRILSHGWTQL